MATYAAVIQQYLSAAVAAGYDTVALNPILWANAYDAADPGQLSLNGTQLGYRGRAMQGPPIDLPQIMAAPGWGLWELTSDGSTDFTIDPGNPPNEILQPFTYSDVLDLIGQNAVNFLDACVNLIGNQVAGTGLVPTDELNRMLALLRGCVVALPADGPTLNNLYGTTFPGLPTAPSFPDSAAQSGADAWSQVVGQFNNVRQSFAQQQYQTGSDFANVSRANVALWNGIAAAATFIGQTVPSVAGQVVGAAAAAAGNAIGQGLHGVVKGWFPNLSDSEVEDVVILVGVAAAGVAALVLIRVAE